MYHKVKRSLFKPTPPKENPQFMALYDDFLNKV
jgi:hypothetical protein